MTVKTVGDGGFLKPVVAVEITLKAERVHDQMSQLPEFPPINMLKSPEVGQLWQLVPLGIL